jgi:hypothetical protein
MSPAIPVMARRLTSDEIARHLTSQGIFERGDHIYLQTPVQMFRPTGEQIEEFAFSKAVKQNAPNENLVWFKGSYVEADNPNGNGAMWRAEELSIKSLTPMLMPVTVMHDPRTAVGTIADVKLLTPEKDSVPRSRIDTVLALWGHRFPDAVNEAEVNAQSGSLMQSMECYSPWYECSECGQVFHKLPGGAERANWCAHLVAANHPDDSMRAANPGSNPQTSNASRILGDVCFTGTGLIFGTRGSKGAYSEAHLESFEDELASYHQQVHHSTATREIPRMGLVQIEDTELATLRKERDDAKSEATTAKTAESEARRAAEEAEAAKTAAETAKTEAERKLAEAEEATAKVQLRDTRMSTLGEGFTTKLGEFTSKRLKEDAGTLDDAAWEERLKELEETTSTKRDAKKDGEPTDPENKDGDKGKGKDGKDGEEADLKGTLFDREEVAKLGVGGEGGQPPSNGSVDPGERASVVGTLAGAFKS